MISKVVTRKSPLALLQAGLVCDLLNKKIKDTLHVKLPISTFIDSYLNYSLEDIDQTGLFTKELDDYLLSNKADLAIHSSKDLPVKLNKELAIAGYLPRGPVSDVLIMNKPIEDIQIIGTSSSRRRNQIKSIFPLAEFKLIRGNVETRLEKLCSGDYDATILALAGLKRLSIDTYKDLIFKELDLCSFIPAAGQGAIAIICRQNDLNKYKNIFCAKTYEEVSIEKFCLEVLDSGCNSPTGVYFCKSNLSIFHPSIGVKHYKIKGLDNDRMKRELAKILSKIK